MAQPRRHPRDSARRQGPALGDIATSTLQARAPDLRAQPRRRPAVGFDIYQRTHANLVEVGTRRDGGGRAHPQRPELQGIRVYALDDQAENVTSFSAQLGKAGLEGTLLSVLVLFFFLRDWPSTLMVSLAIPICFVITLGCMYFFGITLNVLSMMGLLLAVGMLVDNAVVVVESIYQYREKHPDKPWYCAVQGTQVVGIAIAAGTLDQRHRVPAEHLRRERTTSRSSWRRSRSRCRSRIWPRGWSR